jgi:hypothetical protein
MHDYCIVLYLNWPMRLVSWWCYGLNRLSTLYNMLFNCSKSDSHPHKYWIAWYSVKRSSCTSSPECESLLKTKVQLSLSVPWRQIGGIAVLVHPFLTSALDVSEWSIALPLGKNSGTHWALEPIWMLWRREKSLAACWWVRQKHYTTNFKAHIALRLSNMSEDQTMRQVYRTVIWKQLCILWAVVWIQLIVR